MNPKKERNDLIFLGIGHVFKADILSGSALIQFSQTQWPA